jgi:membrane-bound serine protease (ClpP class)
MAIRAGLRGSLTLPGWLILCGMLMATGIVPLGQLEAQENQADPESPIVYVIPIDGPIEPGIGHFLERSLSEAEEAGATTVILEINTPGGRLDTVLEMRDAILDSPLHVVAYVNREAFSAGALITIAAHDIWLAPGGVFGAATPIIGTETADAKTIAAVRSTFRATAETRGRDPIIAEAMVDPAVEIPGLDSAETLLSLSSDQAQQWNYAEGTATSRADLLAQLGLADSVIRVVSPALVETAVRWITEPAIASLLILLGLFLIVADGVFAGFGVAAVAGVACLGLFFWGHLLANLAGWEDLGLILLGVALLAVEVFVIPGFGFAGIAGILALGSGLFLSMVGRGFHDFALTDDAVRAGWTVVAGVIGAAAALILLGWVLSGYGRHRTRRGIGGGLMLQTTVGDSHDATAVTAPSWLVRKLGGANALDPGGTPMPEGEPPSSPR